MINEADKLAMLKALGEQVATNGRPFFAVFDNEYVSVVDTESTSPSLIVRTSDISGLRKGSEIMAGSVAYRIRRIEPENDGFSRVMLEK